MALTQGRKTQERDGKHFSFGVKANAVIHQGGLVMLAAGLAIAARSGQGADQAAQQADAATLKVVGIAEEGQTGTAVDGEARVPVKRGTFLFKNSGGGDAITAADIEADCYAVDDETVAKTSNTNTRAKAGTIVDVESDGVWVRVGA